MTRKRTNNEQKMRRELEILRAQMKHLNPVGTVEDSTPAKDVKEEKYKLPTKEIKKDLMKTSLYAIFVVIVILFFKYSHVDFTVLLKKLNI